MRALPLIFLLLFPLTAAAQAPISVETIPGELLTERDPVYVPEFPVAYSSLTLMVRFSAREQGSYLVAADFAGQEKDVPTAARYSFSFQERLEGSGTKEVRFNLPAAELQKQQGLLWSWIPGRKTNVTINVVRHLTRAEAIASVKPEELEKIRADIQNRYGSELAEKYMNELLPPQRGIERPYLSGEFEIPYAAVMRTAAKGAPGID